MRPGDHPTARRSNAFASWRELFDRLKGRGSYAPWRTEILEDYCRFGVVPNPHGTNWILACPPQVEAAIYTGAVGNDINELLRRIDIPVAVLRAQPRTSGERMDFLGSPTWPELANQFAQGRDIPLPQLTHFIPMQAPELVAAIIEDHDAAMPAAS
jgi:pimeloyl-ACP methyl ester carboxylesterase